MCVQVTEGRSRLKTYDSLREASVGIVPSDVTEAQLRSMWHVKVTEGPGVVKLKDFRVYGEATTMPTRNGRRSTCKNFDTTTTVERKRGRSPSMDDSLEPLPPIPMPVVDTYDLGGDPEHVAEILEARPEWDQEVVEELLRWGAKPRLLSVDGVMDGVHFRRVRCTFVQPSGRHVEHVWLPIGTVTIEYPEHVRLLP